MPMTIEERKQKSRERAARWRAENPERAKAYRQSEKGKQSHARSVAKKADFYAEYRSQWERDNKERRNARRRELYAENPQAGRDRALRYLSKTGVRQLVAERTRKAKERPEVRERIQLNKQNRRTSTNGGKLSRGIVSKLMALQSGCCAACRSLLARTGHHLDHIEPLARGGKHADENMQLLCPPCNLSKNAKDPIAWAQSQGRLL